MFTSKFRTRSFLSLSIATLALAIGAASSFANAAVIDEAATAAAKRQDLTSEQWQALSVEDRYRALVMQCNRLPDNSRALCASRAGLPSILTGTERWQPM